MQSHLLATSIVLSLVSVALADTSIERPPAESLPIPLGATRDQVLLGDRIFHGEAASGQCFVCHGSNARGTGNGNDLTTGMFIWGDGSLKAIRATILHNMEIAPRMDGALTAGDVDAVAAYVWAISHRQR
ncbi:MAG TPA: c-type cytochrome [Acidisphaera sp.]|nr:c-type cytochrome [Acidisphaera sp.]